MGKFATDAQVILQFDPDGVISNGTAGIMAKAQARGHTSRLVTVRGRGGDASLFDKIELAAKLSFLGPNFRLYLRGHGDWQSQTLGGWTAAHVADLLAAARMPLPAVVSVTGCSLGRDAGSSEAGRVAHSVDSFGSAMHRLLKTVCGHKTSLYARVYVVGTWGPREITDAKWGAYMGRKDTKYGGAEVQGRAHSKLLFTWNGDTQERRWADDDGDVA